MDEKVVSEVIFPSKTMKIEKQQQKHLTVWNRKEAQMYKNCRRVVPRNWLQLSDPTYGARHVDI